MALRLLGRGRVGSSPMLHRFHQLVEQYQDRVFTYARYFLGDPQEAEDVTQEVLLRLWRNLETVEPAAAAAWILRVTRNASLDALRRRKSRNRVFDDGGDADRVDRVPAAQPGPDAGLATWDVERHLCRALEQLGEPYRSIVILREIQELKYTEISATLKLPLNTVKTYLHRARRRLRDHLQEVHCYAQSS